MEKNTKSEKNREMKELERATRTVFINNLNIKVTEKDLFILFTQKAGKVLDIYVICDKHTNKSKGLAYVELETIESMARALDMSGTALYGQPIQVKPSEMEKNVQWTLQKQAQQGIMNSHLASMPLLSSLTPGVDVAAAAAAAAALLSTSGPNLMENQSYIQDDQQHRKIYIGNLPREINELVLRNMFEPFGFVESSNVIKDPTGKSQGYGFILFRDRNIVDKAIQAMNGMLIGSNIIKVNYVTPNNGQQMQSAVHSAFSTGQTTETHNDLQLSSSAVDLDQVSEGDELKINPQSRIMLMQKLAASAKVAVPSGKIPSITNPLDQEVQSSSHLPSTRFRLGNMFDPSEVTEDNGCEYEIEEDVNTELAKIGPVRRVSIEKNAPGYVYVEMSTAQDASRAVESLRGRIYGGKQVTVEYQF